MKQILFFLVISTIPLFAAGDEPLALYSNNLKNRQFGKEAPQNFCLERTTIAGRQGVSEDENSEVKLTPPKTDSSSCLGISTPNPETLNDTLNQNEKVKWIDVSFYNGYVKGESKELVYNRTESGEVYILSQLDWETGNLWVVGSKVMTNFQENRLHVSLDGWTKAAVSKGTMFDRDWLDEDALDDFTDISVSESSLIKAYQMTGELGWDSITYKRGRFAIKYSLLAGYEYLRLFWKDRGGFYVYSKGKYAGEFENRVGISYDQRFSIPYLGIQCFLCWNDALQIDYFIKFSSNTSVWSQDIHHLRNITFDEKFRNCNYVIVGASVGYNIWKQLNFNLKYNLEELSTSLGTAELRKENEPTKKYGGVGTFHNHQTVSLGLSSAF